jgi:hypothetical protein
MAALYNEIVEFRPDVFVVYLSTGAWNTAAALTRFLAQHGYPPGPLLLTDWGTTQTGWFRSGQDRARATTPAVHGSPSGPLVAHRRRRSARPVPVCPGSCCGTCLGSRGGDPPAQHHRTTGQPRDTEPPGTARSAPMGRLSTLPMTAPDGFGLAQGLHERNIVLGPPS